MVVQLAVSAAPRSSKTVLRPLGLLACWCGGWFWDVGNLAGFGVEVGKICGTEGELVQQLDADVLATGLDGVPASGLDEFLQQSEDAAGAAVEVLGHVAVAEHAVLGFQQP
jgi:hypothetical protein